MATKYNVLNLGMCVHYLDILKAIQCKRFLCGSLCVCVHMYSVCIHAVHMYTYMYMYVYWHCHIVTYLWEGPMVRFDICASSACIVQNFGVHGVCMYMYTCGVCMYVCVCMCMCMCMLLGSSFMC